MLFILGKCKSLHIEHGNTDMNCNIGGTNSSKKNVQENDLGVKMSGNMKLSEQCRIQPLEVIIIILLFISYIVQQDVVVCQKNTKSTKHGVADNSTTSL